MPLWDNGMAGKMLKLNLTLITFINFQVSTNRQPNAISTVDKERSADSLELQMTTYQDTSSTLCELSSFVILLVSNAGISKSQCYRLPKTKSKGWLHRIDLEIKVNTTPSVEWLLCHIKFWNPKLCTPSEEQHCAEWLSYIQACTQGRISIIHTSMHTWTWPDNTLCNLVFSGTRKKQSLCIKCTKSDKARKKKGPATKGLLVVNWA